MNKAALKIVRKIQAAEAELVEYQKQCKHERAVRIRCVDRGDCDSPREDYWNDCTCPDCGKRWVENLPLVRRTGSRCP